MNKILYKGFNYEKKDLRQIDCFIGDALASEKLAVDTFDAVVIDRSLEPTLLVADGLPAVADGLPAVAALESSGLDVRSRYGDPVEYYRGDKLFGKFYLSEQIKRTGKAEYSMSCVSAIGLLLTEEHYGGIYNGQTAGEIIADVVGGVISYTLDESLAAVPLYGWLRKASRRDNLRDVLFAIGGQIRKDTVGALNIIPMTAGESYEITADEFYMGGSVTGGNPATGIIVTEHSFMKLPTDEEVTLFEGDAAAEFLTTPGGMTVSGVMVNFTEPVHDLTIQNAEILESNANYAVISGSPAAVLKGKKYTHTQRLISRTKKTGGTPNVLTSSECTLVSLFNAEVVADRLMAYYGYGKRIEADIVVNGQRPGDSVSFTDPFGDPANGFITDMDLIMSAILKAKTTIVTGFIPTASGNYYSNLMIVSQSGDVTIPAECRGKIRYVLISGGDGGEAGQAGEAGEDGGRYDSFSSGLVKYGTSGAGGIAGAGGLPGKVFVGTMKVSPGQVLYANIGVGGKGAVFGGTPGKGSATTFGGASSENGSRTSGYTGLLTGEVYAIPGEKGVDGGAGQTDETTRPEIELDGTVWKSGTNAETVLDTNIFVFGGLGGGAAVGSDGANGQKGQSVHQSITNTYTVIGGTGADGKTPSKSSNGKTPGSGGKGGHGGGGGGGGGASVGGDDGMGGIGGKPGNGGEAGDGADGLLMIFY